MSKIIDSTKATFTTTGESAGIRGEKVQVLIGGTFVGTVIPQVNINGSWVDIPSKSYTDVTVEMFEFAVGVGFRLRCSAYTSGTIEYDLFGSEEVRK